MQKPMTRMQVWNMFKIFLEINDAWDGFCKAFKEDLDYDSLVGLRREEKPYDWIGAAFYFHSTKEGTKYWENLRERWEEITDRIWEGE